MPNLCDMTLIKSHLDFDLNYGPWKSQIVPRKEPWHHVHKGVTLKSPQRRIQDMI